MRPRWSPARIGLLLFFGLNVTAVLVGRMAGPSPSWRSPEGVRHVSINYYLSNEAARDLRYLDLATGRLGILPIPEGDLLDQASWSPWVDQDGRSQVVGRWASRSGEGTEKVNRGFGLARLSFPGGEILDKIDSEVQPSSPACWFPDTSARILFSGGDGEVYRFAFEGPPGPETDGSGRDLRPRKLRWASPRPGGGQVYLGEPHWPSNTPGKLGGRVFVSLSHERVDGKKLAISPPKIWSLKLDLAGTSIEAADRLADDFRPETRGEHQRFPVVGTATDGTPILAFLSRHPQAATWDLLVVPLDVSGLTPRFDRARARVLVESCAPMPPVLSADCRWVTCSTVGPGGRVETRRVAVPIPAEPEPEDSLMAGRDTPPHS